MSYQRTFPVLLVAAACGPTDVPDAELRELCGEVGPVRVLEFPDDASPFAIARVEQVSDDVLLWQLSSTDSDSLSYPWPSRAWGVWLTGICGESPRQIPGVISARLDPYLPGLVMTNPQTIPGTQIYDYVVIDPKEPEAQHVLFTGVGLPLGKSRHGLFSVDEIDDRVGTLSFRAFPEDPFSGPIAPTPLVSIRGPFTPIGLTAASDLTRSPSSMMPSGY